MTPQSTQRHQNPDVVSPSARSSASLGTPPSAKGRWNDFHRHTHSGEGKDWHDILEMDWPSVRADIEAGALVGIRPSAGPRRSGLKHVGEARRGVSVGLAWAVLDDDGFERLLFDLLRSFPSYQNIEWAHEERAPDRRRDLSAERVIKDDGGTTRLKESSSKPSTGHQIGRTYRHHKHIEHTRAVGAPRHPRAGPGYERTIHHRRGSGG